MAETSTSRSESLADQFEAALENFPGRFRTDPDTGRITRDGKGYRYTPDEPQVGRDRTPPFGYPRELSPFPNLPDPFRVLAETPL